MLGFVWIFVSADRSGASTAGKIPAPQQGFFAPDFELKTPKGQTIRNDEVTAAPDKGKKYAFCADTRYEESIIPYIRGADMIYHETTYLDNVRDKAFERFHCTTKQAAEIAMKASVKKLLISLASKGLYHMACNFPRM